MKKVLAEYNLEPRQYPPRAMLCDDLARPRASWQDAGGLHTRATGSYFEEIVGPHATTRYQQLLTENNAPRLRRHPRARRWSCSATGRRSRSATASATSTSWSTSSRTPTSRSTCWPSSWRRRPTPTSASSATRTSRSTPGARPTSATSSTSSTTTRRRTSSAWSRTTARTQTILDGAHEDHRRQQAAQREEPVDGEGPRRPDRRLRGLQRRGRGRRSWRRRGQAPAAQQGGLHLGDMAVMYRTNAQSRAMEERFVAERLPYRLVGGTRFYERARDQGPAGLPAPGPEPVRLGEPGRACSTCRRAASATGRSDELRDVGRQAGGAGVYGAAAARASEALAVREARR